MGHDAGVVCHGLDGAVFVEYDAVVVFDRCVLLISHFHLSVGKRVDFVFLNRTVHLLGLVVEERGQDLGSDVVDQLDVEQAAGSSVIFPSLFLVLLRHACLDLPVKQESVKRFNWGVSASLTHSVFEVVRRIGVSRGVHCYSPFLIRSKVQDLL